MTTTTILNGVTVGSTPATISNVAIHTFGATAGAYSVQASLTTGAAQSPNKLVIYYAAIADNLAATVASAVVAQSAAQRLELPPNQQPVQQKLYTTDTYGCRGRYLLVWIEEPSLGAAATLTVKVTEF